MMGFSRSFSILVVLLLGASSCSAITSRVLKTNTHCIRANDMPLCPGDEMHLESDTVKIAAGFPDNSRVLTTWKPFWEETLWIGTHSQFDLPGFDKSMKNIFFGDDSCLYGNVGWNLVGGGFWTTNAQLIKCVNEHYDGEPYPNPWAEENYGPVIAEEQLDLSEPAHNKKGASVWDYRKLPQREGDPDEKLPAYNGWNPFLRGVHQNSQWPQHYPLHYDPTGPKKNRQPSAESAPDAVDSSKDAAKTDGTVLGGTAGTPVVSTGDTTTTSTEAAAAATSSTVASTDGSVASTDGSVGSVASTDGSVASTDGTVTPAGGTIASTDGTAASTDGSVASTDITVASSLTTDTTTQDLTAQADPSVKALPFRKRSRRSFLNPRDFRVQMW